MLHFERTKKKKGLLIVPSLTHIEQMQEDFCDYSEKNKWDVLGKTHQIYHGQDNDTDAFMYISTWQSLYKLPEEYFRQFDFVMVDEVHLAKGKSIKYIMESCVNAEHRIGTTGTLNGEYVDELVIEGLFGKIFEVEKTHKMIEKNEASALKVKNIILDYTDLPTKQIKFLSHLQYPDEIKFLQGFPKRNKLICQLVYAQKGNRLVLFEQRKHGTTMFEKFKEMYPDVKVFYIDGTVNGKKRNVIRKYVNEQDDCVLFATYKTFSTGVNMPSLRHVFSTISGKARIKILQSIGRILRLHETKQTAYFWDIADKMSFKKKINTTYTHYLKRLVIYNQQRFDFKPTRIGINEL